MKQIFAIGLFSLLVLSSCDFIGGERISGDGNVISQSRDIKDFENVDVSSAMHVYLTQDSGFSVKVEADNNLQEFIEVYKEGNTLHIRQANNTSLNPSKTINVHVSAPVFKSLRASGACTLHGENRLSSPEGIAIELSGASEAKLEVKAPRTSLGLSGASHVDIKGETRELGIDGSGSCGVNAFDLLAEQVSVDLSGASNADVYASVKVEGEASGASHVRYKGAGTSSISTSGASGSSKFE